MTKNDNSEVEESKNLTLSPPPSCTMTEMTAEAPQLLIEHDEHQEQQQQPQQQQQQQGGINHKSLGSALTTTPRASQKEKNHLVENDNGTIDEDTTKRTTMRMRMNTPHRGTHCMQNEAGQESPMTTSTAASSSVLSISSNSSGISVLMPSHLGEGPRLGLAPLGSHCPYELTPVMGNNTSGRRYYQDGSKAGGARWYNKNNNRTTVSTLTTTMDDDSDHHTTSTDKKGRLSVVSPLEGVFQQQQRHDEEEEEEEQSQVDFGKAMKSPSSSSSTTATCQGQDDDDNDGGILGLVGSVKEHLSLPNDLVSSTSSSSNGHPWTGGTARLPPLRIKTVPNRSSSSTTSSSVHTVANATGLALHPTTSSSSVSASSLLLFSTTDPPSTENDKVMGEAQESTIGSVACAVTGDATTTSSIASHDHHQQALDDLDKPIRFPPPKKCNSFTSPQQYHHPDSTATAMSGLDEFTADLSEGHYYYCNNEPTTPTRTGRLGFCGSTNNLMHQTEEHHDDDNEDDDEDDLLGLIAYPLHQQQRLHPAATQGLTPYQPSRPEDAMLEVPPEEELNQIFAVRSHFVEGPSASSSDGSFTGDPKRHRLESHYPSYRTHSSWTTNPADGPEQQAQLYARLEGPQQQHPRLERFPSLHLAHRLSGTTMTDNASVTTHTTLNTWAGDDEDEDFVPSSWSCMEQGNSQPFSNTTTLGGELGLVLDEGQIVRHNNNITANDNEGERQHYHHRRESSETPSVIVEGILGEDLSKLWAAQPCAPFESPKQSHSRPLCGEAGEEDDKEDLTAFSSSDDDDDKNQNNHHYEEKRQQPDCDTDTTMAIHGRYQKEQEAIEWLQSLQVSDASKIAEAASSKFLCGTSPTQSPDRRRRRVTSISAAIPSAAAALATTSTTTSARPIPQHPNSFPPSIPPPELTFDEPL